ncbi:MAG: guanylate kinase [Bacteroidetes bacterium]|nr:MAG: guanylate kinase [Bacteroidota bacterium]
MSSASDQKRLIVVTAPSGSGKTTIVRHLLAKYNSLAFSVSAATRARRAHEKHGVDYYFVSGETFRQWIDEDAFVEWQEVYTDQYYGTPRFEIERLHGLGRHVIFDIDVVGATNIKREFQDQAVVIFVKAPSMDAIIERLKSRKTETEQSLQKRIKKIERELQFADTFDYVLVNDNLEEALQRAEQIIEKEIT